MRINDKTRKEIRDLHKTGRYSYAELANIFDISTTSVGRIVNPVYQERERKNSKMRQRGYTPPKAVYAVNLRFSANENHLIDKLKSVYNIQQYIKSLIEEDLKNSHNI